MTKKERVGYLLCTVASFISGFIIFAYIGTHGPWAPGGVSESKVFMLFGLAGGLAVAVTLSGVILTTWVVRESSTVFKIIVAFLWPVTAACAVCVGIVTFIPYEIFNLIRIFMYGRKGEKAPVRHSKISSSDEKAADGASEM